MGGGSDCLFLSSCDQTCLSELRLSTVVFSRTAQRHNLNFDECLVLRHHQKVQAVDLFVSTSRSDSNRGFKCYDDSTRTIWCERLGTSEISADDMVRLVEHPLRLCSAC
mgnify:CR=1 FL=1